MMLNDDEEVITCPTWDGKTFLEPQEVIATQVTAYAYVHPGFDRLHGPWVVTHRDSGYSLLNRVPTEDLARKLAKVLDSILPLYSSPSRVRAAFRELPPRLQKWILSYR